jgi:hypothetical protein
LATSSDWVKFIGKRFKDTGKEISKELCGKIADMMQNHPYYTQQLSQQVWLRTDKVCDETIFQSALEGMIGQCQKSQENHPRQRPDRHLARPQNCHARPGLRILVKKLLLMPIFSYLC